MIIRYDGTPEREVKVTQISRVAWVEMLNHGLMNTDENKAAFPGMKPNEKKTRTCQFPRPLSQRGTGLFSKRALNFRRFRGSG